MNKKMNTPRNNMNNDNIIEDFNIDDEDDYEVPEEYYIDVEKITPEFVGWVKYGGDFCKNNF